MFGRELINQTGRDVRVSSNGAEIYPSGGTTIDWTTFAAAQADTTLPDDSVLKLGQKAIRYGQVLCKITASVNGSVVGAYGPYDPAATDGRQNLVRGQVLITNVTTFQRPTSGIGQATDYVQALEGGRCWKARIIATNGAASLAAGPTFATLEAALPLLQYTTQA